MSARTVLVLGDQLSRSAGALASAEPGRDRVVMVETLAKVRERPWHRQKLTYVWSAMRHLRDELRDAGFTVAYHRADTLRAGLAEEDPDRLVVMAPSSYDLRRRLTDWGVTQTPNDAFIVGEEPVGGRWNLDADNRQPPPSTGVDPPSPYRPREDEVDAEVRADVAALEHDLGLTLYGEDRPRAYPATRAEARRALAAFLDRALDGFGPLEDAVVADEPVLWHSPLSAPLNLGLLHPAEVCDAVDRHWRDADGQAELSSYEGFLRQVCGWREYVWGLYWWRMPAWRDDNHLGHHGDVPAAFWTGDTDLRCVSATVTDLLGDAWTHHIPRLMILGGYALTAGVNPQRLADWFHALYIDGHEWVMLPNVVGMSQWADGGVMASKPYASGGRYLDKMTDYCGDCVFDPTTRTADDSCPFNALYWDFLSRHRRTLATNRRMAPILANLDRFDDAERRAIRTRARRFRTDA